MEDSNAAREDWDGAERDKSTGHEPVCLGRVGVTMPHELTPNGGGYS